MMNTGLIHIGVIALSSVVLYASTLTFTFVYDDQIQILANWWVESLRNIPLILRSGSFDFMGEPTNTYRPLAHIIFTLEYALFGRDPWGYHLVNVVLHTANSVLVYLLIRTFFKEDDGEGNLSSSLSPLGGGAPLLGALLFVVHPLNSEPVSWVSSVPELAFVLLLLSALLVHATDKYSEPSPLKVALTSLLFFVSLLGKETAISLLFLIPLYDYYVRGYFRWRAYAAYTLVAAAYMAVRTSIIGGLISHEQIDITLWESIINIPTLLFHYISKLLWPAELSAQYLYVPIKSVSSISTLLHILLLLLIIGAVIFAFFRDRRVIFPVGLIFIPLGPVLYLPALSVSALADRYTYLSTAGLSILFTYLIIKALSFRGGELKRPLYTASVLLVLTLGVLSFNRSQVWSDSRSLWSDTISKFPLSITAHYNMGLVYSEAGEVEEAIKEMRETLRIDPDHEDAIFNLGALYQNSGRYREAAREYMRLLEKSPGTIDARYNLGIVFMNMGYYKEAVNEFGEVLRLDPAHEGAKVGLRDGRALYNKSMGEGPERGGGR